MAGPFDRETLLKAFEALGEELAARRTFVEVAIYGGCAMMMQIEWHRATEDVDAVVREGYDEAVLFASVDAVAVRLGLDPDWMNDAVGMFTPLEEDDDWFALSGSYPAGSAPGLRVVLARPHYLLAMKLQAMRSTDRGDRDLRDARMLARHLGVTDPAELDRLYRSIHGEAPPADSAVRFPSVLLKH